MRRFAVIIPVKGKNHKSRLAKWLGVDEREELARLLLADLIRPLRASGLLRQAYVVSSSQEMISVAEAQGGQGIVESGDRGFNSAVELGMEELKDFEEFLILPSDLPLLTRADLRAAVAMRESGIHTVISPSLAFDGTNLLSYSRDKPLQLSYDDDSFWNHVSNAGKAGLSMSVYTSRGVMTDVDSEGDVARLLRLSVNRESIDFLRRVWPKAGQR
ncbi:MAG TPA: 2-phospho-L-lactate guanylyltransferase [Nitrososphaerales archaeon]|nr:2-phospho-L-lactate guanylyltransferase [Nitrososphaerales archaeon]